MFFPLLTVTAPHKMQNSRLSWKVSCFVSRIQLCVSIKLYAQLFCERLRGLLDNISEQTASWNPKNTNDA